ncbi:RecT protein [Thermaerobacter marianensis DSM 12885]|uniref:RecT protein n=1 Tax=Thermaerobacter marianensis (strain ATCC 700841 / DSM 12885 / JCM 10246 / 7p75a) TaxID=644966 RepID=E6SKG0_THEM7|nr:recombinase RecT [Thermaerobacter marianensis]ADU50147.1 RecT protein [Thermaerobacter marianensis DSM 12885]
MAVQTDQVRNKLARRAQENGAPAPSQQPKTIEQWLRDERFRAEIERALPRHLSADRLLRITLTVLRTTPELRRCTVPSLLAAVLQCAQLGLEPGVLGHVYLVPFKNGKTGEYEVQVIIGYKGWVELARRSGQIQSLTARVVYQNDEFELSFGIEDNLRHVPWYMRPNVQDGGPIRGAYSVARFKDGGYHLHYMPIQQIEARRKRSRAADSGPWKTDYEAMVLKTVVRDASKWWPLSPEIARGLAQDESIKRTVDDVDSDAPYFGEDVIDVQGEDVGEGGEDAAHEEGGDASAGGDGSAQFGLFGGGGQ